MTSPPSASPTSVLLGAQLNELARRERISIAVAFPAIFLITWLHRDVTPLTNGIGWVIFQTLLLLARFTLSLQNFESTESPAYLLHVRNLRVLLSILYGAGWGAMLMVFDSGQADFLFMLKIATIASVLGVTLNALSVVLPVYIGFITPLLLLLTAYILAASFLQPDEQMALLIGVVVYGVLIVVTSNSVAKLTRGALEQSYALEAALNAAQASHLREIDLRERLQAESALLAQTNQSLHAANEQLTVLARQDPLTGAYNRRHLMDELERQVQLNIRYRTEFSIIILDVDHFKAINDTHGHQVGDLVLIGLTRLLKDSLREIDVCGRWGGEEFLCILPNTPIPEALYCAERLRRTLAEARLIDTLPELTATASFGVGTCRENESIDALLQRVDAELYAAKTAGRNQIKG